MGRRDEPAAQGSHEVLAGRVSWLWENRAGIPFDVEPGPSGQWYFADWTSDPVVRQMSCTARAMHIDCICYAWSEHPPCSLPAEEDDLEDLLEDLDGRDRRRFLRAWHTGDGRIWQPGLCKTYLQQVSRRLRKVRGPFVKAGNELGLARLREVEAVLLGAPPFAGLSIAPALHEQCTSTAPAQGGPSSSSSSSSSSSGKKKTSPTGTPASGSRPLNAQAQRIQRIEAIFEKHDEKPPAPKILALWLKSLGSEEKMTVFLGDMAARGKLGVMEYCGKVVRDWTPPKGRGGKSASPSGFLPESAFPDGRPGEEGF